MPSIEPVKIDELPTVTGQELLNRAFIFLVSQDAHKRRMSDEQLAELVASILQLGALAQANTAAGVPVDESPDGPSVSDMLNAIAETLNGLGSAATRDVGAAEGEIPILDEAGTLPMEALAPDPAAELFLRGDGAWVEIFDGVGSGQTWQDVAATRAVGTSYQNTTGRPIMVALTATNTSVSSNIQVSANNSSWVTVGRSIGISSGGQCAFVVPNGWFYRVQLPGGGTTTIGSWAELRS